MYVELLSADGDDAIFGDHVGPRLCIIRIVVVRRHGFLSLNTDRRRHYDEESKAQQKPTMNEAACCHVLTVFAIPCWLNHLRGSFSNVVVLFLRTRSNA